MKTKLNATIAGALALLGSDLASAAIGNGPGYLPPGSVLDGELFLEVWNGVSGPNGRSWTLDTGMSLPELRSNPSAYFGSEFTLTGLPTSGDTALGPNAVWAVYAVHDDSFYSFTGSNAPDNFYGVLSTVVGPIGGFDPTSMVANLGSHVSSINVQLGGAATDFAANVQQVFTSGEVGYFRNLSPAWMSSQPTPAWDFTNPVLGNGETSMMEVFFMTFDDQDFLSPFVGNSGNPVGKVMFTVNGDGTATLQYVPIPAAVWLFGSALAGLVGFARRKTA